MLCTCSGEEVAKLGLTAGAVHLPLHRIDGKRAREAGLARGFQALRVPAWDEDPLTMAIEAGLRLPDEAIEGADRIRLFLEEASEQASLAARALDLDVPVVQSTGEAGLVAELAASAAGEELWLAAGGTIGGAGIALRVGQGGAAVGEAASADTGPLDPDGEAAVQAALDEVAPDEGLARLALPGLASLATDDPAGLSVGQTGPAGPGLELLAHLADGTEPAVLGALGEAQAYAVRLGGGTVPVEGWQAPSVELAVATYRERQRADPPAWSEASQGAYVSREVYDADPERRYGARARAHGEVAAVTTIEAGPPAEFARQHEAGGPYDVLIVSFAEGGREIGQAAAAPGQVSIGDEVRPVLRRVFSLEGQVRYGLKWRPTES